MKHEWTFLIQKAKAEVMYVWIHTVSPSRVKARLSKSNGKVIMVTFCDSWEIVLQHSVPLETTFNVEYIYICLVSSCKLQSRRRDLSCINPGALYTSITGCISHEPAGQGHYSNIRLSNCLSSGSHYM